MKIPISDLFSHSIVIWTNKGQLDYCLSHFEDVFGKQLTSKIMPVHGFDRRSKTVFYDAFSNGARNCSFAHAMALSICNALNWPFVCIFEQDAWFNNEVILVQELQQHLDNIPDGYTTILLGLTQNSKLYNCKDEKLNDYWFKLQKYKHQRGILCGSHAYVVLNANNYKGKNGLDNRYIKLFEQGIADNSSFSHDDFLCYSIPSFFRQKNTESYVNSTLHKWSEKDAYIM